VDGIVGATLCADDLPNETEFSKRELTEEKMRQMDAVWKNLRDPDLHHVQPPQEMNNLLYAHIVAL
jgi:hypothetical protein